MSFHKDQSGKFKKVRVSDPWRIDQETVGTEQALPWLDPVPVHRCTLYLSGSAVGVVDWNVSGFYDQKFYAMLSGSDRFLVLPVENEEGYVPPQEIRFGPQKKDREDGAWASEEPLCGTGEEPQGGTDEGPAKDPDGGAGDPGAAGAD